MAKQNLAVIDLDEVPTGAKFYWDEKDTSGPWVDLRIVPMETLDGFRKQCTTKKVEYVVNTISRKMDRVDSETFDDDKFNALIWDHAIVSWGGGWVDKAGKEHPCDTETKVKFMKNAKFNKFVSKCLTTLQEDAAKDAEDIEKNS